VLDHEKKGEIYNGVPCKGNKGNKVITFVAPNEPGVYMLWHYNDLQYSLNDASKNLKDRHKDYSTAKAWYGKFLAWVEVKN
jgi:hypothetical protein